ncbi:MAG: hydantoinase B/oxoprolinase family protein [Candidatus Binatia bacterium]
MKSTISPVDPIRFEIISHRLHQIAKETGITLERVGGTVNTTQQRDYMAALYRANGDLLCAGATMGQHVACAGFAVKRILERFGDEICPDDLFLLNDPYLAAIHQSDIYTISPIHYKDFLVGWSATFVHVMDIGALSPGGDSPNATEIFHEGLRIPGIKLIDGGKLRQDVFDTLINMTRQPVMVGLDLKCEIAANNVAKARMRDIYSRYGPQLVDDVSGEMIGHSQNVLERRLSEIPDGQWRSSARIEGDFVWRIALELRKKDKRLTFDFAGTDPQARTGVNQALHATFGWCFAAVLSTLAYDIPKNHGVFQVMEATAPAGTLVNVQYPGPVSLNTTSCGVTTRYLANAGLMQMLSTSEAFKNEVMGLNAGHRNAKHAGRSQHGRYAVFNMAHGALDGSGARAFEDGINSGGSHMSCPNVEWFEMNFPILYLFRRHVKDAAGAGKFRGGAGVETAHMLHDCPDDRITGVAYGAAGATNSGQGLFGGYPGAPSIVKLLENTRAGEIVSGNGGVENITQVGGAERFLPYCEFELKNDSVVYMRVASGGGYGDPLKRDPDRVLTDVINGIVSTDSAREIYGVVIDLETGKVDRPATEELRSALRQQRFQPV